MGIEGAVRLGLSALESGDEQEALPIMADAIRRWPLEPRLWQVQGLLQRGLGDLGAAVAAFERSASLGPGDARIALGHARCALEAGYPALALFERALTLAREREQVIPGLAAALLSERRADEAIRRVEDHLLTQPHWLEGHWLASRLRWLAADRQHYTSSIKAALAEHPRSIPLWRQGSAILMMAERFDEALEVVNAGRRAAGSDPGFDLDAAICLSETWALKEADLAYAALPPIDDLGIALHKTRHLLRLGRPDCAAELALRFEPLDKNHSLIPYLSVAWRLLGDGRWRWLEADDRLVGVYDLAEMLPSLETLAQLLRQLHVTTDQPPEQSLRGGTQTDGPLLSRTEPEIRQLRAVLAEAVAAHIRQLPAVDPRHPTLAGGRGKAPRFAGSWSARLAGAGRHAMHVHPEGWISSALYVSLPQPAQRGAGPAGWLSLGEPQENLGIKLPPIRRVEPRPGRLVLFPSTMWHGTLPYAAGERLSVAFDVAWPRGTRFLPVPPDVSAIA